MNKLLTSICRFILPVLGEYSDAGYREPRDKLLYSLRENAQFHAIVLGASLIGLVYVIIAYGFSVTSLRALVMALAYCWGLVLAIYLMGHGLVSIPRRLIRDASITGKLRRLQTHAPRAYEKMEDSLSNLEEIEAQVTELGKRKVGSAADFRDWIEELQDMANIPQAQPHATLLDANTLDRTVPTVITEKYLADLTRRLIRARHARSRYMNEWHRLVRNAARTQAILDSGASKKLDFGETSPHAGFWERTTFLSPHSRYIWQFHVAPYLQIGLGVFLAAASACIIWSELVKFPLPKLSIISVSVVHHWVGDKPEVGFAGQVISAFWICYMCAAALITMTEVKVWRGRALVKRNTGYESAFWYSMQVAKLSVPLSYNFLTFLSPDIYKKTTFYHFLGEFINETKFGQWFDDLFPIFLVFPVLATLFGLYSKVKRVFVGADFIEDEENNPSGYGTGSWREGRDLIERELGSESIRRRDELYARLNTASGGGTGRNAPILSVPAITDTTDGGGTRTLGQSGGDSSRGGNASRTRYLDDPPEDESFLQLLGHRMKNTMDTIDTPKWFQDIGQGIKKPKWMGGGDDGGSSSNNQSGDIRRWFGGGGGEGQVRL